MYMYMAMNEFKKGVNPYGIPYAAMTTGKHVIVDIPINHNGEYAEVEGIISRELWFGSPNSVYSQIKITMQRTQRNKIMLYGGLYAVYPEKIKKISD